MPRNIKTGRYGERLAEEFLQGNGYEILERNYRFKRGEIDLIAKRDEVLVFVEVKLRNNLAFGDPEEFVSPKQQDLIKEVAEEYILKKDWQRDIRFDIISIYNSESPEIEHFEDAFY